MNTICIEGRLVREPEFNYVEKGDTSLAIVTLTIAENIYAGKDRVKLSILYIVNYL